MRNHFVDQPVWKRPPLRRFLATLGVAALAVTVSAGCAREPRPAGADTTARKPATTPEERAIDQFARLVNGTWILKQRTNPDGTEHRKPLKGWTKINIARQDTKTMRPRALGTISCVEEGVWDGRWGKWCPDEAKEKPFFIESNGTWEVTLDPKPTKRAGPGEVNLLVAQVSTVKGNYRPYTNGLISSMDARYILRMPTVERAEGGREVRRGAQAVLVLAEAPMRLTEPETFRGKAVVAAEAMPLDEDHQPIAREAMANVACSCSEFSVGGNQINITWESGGTDTWTR
jgi:hypothetical protein